MRTRRSHGETTTAALNLARVRLVWGELLILAPRSLIRLGPGAILDARSVAYARVLGARHLTQGLLTRRVHRPRSLWVGAGVDALHGVSALWLMRRCQHRRGPLALNATVAFVFALAGARAAIKSDN